MISICEKCEDKDKKENVTQISHEVIEDLLEWINESEDISEVIEVGNEFTDEEDKKDKDISKNEVDCTITAEEMLLCLNSSF